VFIRIEKGKEGIKAEKPKGLGSGKMVFSH
jgi:hypothetical protein